MPLSRIYASYTSLAALIAAAMAWGPTRAEPLSIFFQPPAQSQIAPQFEAEPQQAQPDVTDENAELAPRLRRQIVSYPSKEAPGTIIIDTPHTYLYYVFGGDKAIRYGVGVGSKGFTWAGVKSVARKTNWPDWYPPRPKQL
jgi:lipoprotein-anchoring transpeptidase ErfK/SrfK